MKAQVVGRITAGTEQSASHEPLQLHTALRKNIISFNVIDNDLWGGGGALVQNRRILTRLCCAFAVEHLQDVFGNFLDGVPCLIPQLADAVEDDQPLVALVAGALLLKEGRKSGIT